jgi:hypothetical protein
VVCAIRLFSHRRSVLPDVNALRHVPAVGKHFKKIKMKNLALVWLLIIQVSFLHGQNSVSIYELGDSITDCETNFKNLFVNWTFRNVTNADSYNLLKYSYVETITDSIKFNFYRNYFSGIEPIFSSVSHKKGEIGRGERIYEFYIKPGFIHQEIFDQRGLSPEIREIFTEEFTAKAKDILTRDINIDTISLNYYFYEKNKIDTIIKLCPNFNVYNVRKTYLGSKGASPDSISKNYIDIFIKRAKSVDELKNSEKRPLILEQLLIERINKQLLFNQQVHIGDKVYVIDFEYNGKLFSDYVICDVENKRVVIDYFFKGIILESERD